MQKAFNSEHKALEMTMRDVMDNFEDAASYLALSCPAGLTILSIEAPGEDPLANEDLAELHLHPALSEKIPA